jgi:chlorobactene glucosyltransferase
VTRAERTVHSHARRRERVLRMVRNSYLLALVCMSGYFFVTAVSNVVYLRRATRRPRIKDGPFVSVIVPARNEERSIGGCLKSLLAQDYTSFEVVIVDDDSEDGTAAVVSAVAAEDARVRLVRGAPLPSDWLGKPHALAQGVAAARGEILLLSDADATHSPQSISWAVTNLEDHGADMLSGYPRQEYGTLGESIIVPTMYAMMMLLPLYLIPRTKGPGPAFAIGQYVALRREALDAVGGYEAIKNTIVDDMSMAARMKAFGFRTIFLDAAEAVRCRLYRGYRDAFVGISRSSYSAIGAHPAAIAGVTVVVLAVFIAPALSLLGSLLLGNTPSAPLGVAVGLFAAQWALIVWDRDAPLTAVLLYPVVFANLLAILVTSMVTTGFGPGVEWKGRIIRVPDKGEVPAEGEEPIRR